MDFSTWLFYVSVVILLCLTPGPNSLLAFSNGAKYGVRKTLFSILGCLLGLAVLIAISMTSLGAIFAQSNLAFNLIKWLGTVYLFYIGVKICFSKNNFFIEKDSTASDNSINNSISKTKLFTQGFFIVALNPKVLLFFTAFLTQFYNSDRSLVMQYFILAGTFLVIEGLVEISLAIFANKINREYISSRYEKIVSIFIGLLFVLLSIYLALSSR